MSEPPGSQPALFSLGGTTGLFEEAEALITPELREYAERVDAVLFSRTRLPRLTRAKPADKLDVIFARGRLELLDRQSVAVVGTRDPSADGRKRARAVSRALVDLGYVVMSGLARGIDGEAHRAALDAGGDTIAVMGTAMDRVYPKEHLRLAEEIAERGLLITPASPSDYRGKWLFPRRNRLMALLAVGTVIIEAGEGSGVVHQAAECLRQNSTLVLLRSLVDSGVSWAPGFVKSGAVVVSDPQELASALGTQHS